MATSKSNPAAQRQSAEYTPPAESEALRALRRQWALTALVYAAAVGGGYALLVRMWDAQVALRWLALAALAATAQMAILWWALRWNRHAEGSPLFATLGLANGLTLGRGALTCLLAGFPAAPAPPAVLIWGPALLYGAERLLDLVDGYAARRTRGETRLGAILDIEFDGIGILIAIALAVHYGQLPGWYLLLAVSRPLFVAGMELRRRSGRTVNPLPPSDMRRVIAGLQTGFVAVVLWPIWSAPVARLAGTLFAIPLVASFGRDWLVVSGALDPHSRRYAALRKQAKSIVEGWLPLVARVISAASGITLLLREGGASPLTAGAALLLLPGVLGRAAALVLLVTAALDVMASGLEWRIAMLLIVCAAIVLHAGSGRWALWQPEETIIRRKLGAGKEIAA